MRLSLRCALLACAFAVGPANAQQRAATLIQNARVLDGRGTPARSVSVRIIGDRIAAVGNLKPTRADRVFDAHGLVLAPGFIDTHSHHDRGLFNARSAIAMVSQGVTTIVVGQDGGGSGLAALFARLDTQRVAVNVASYAGHGSIRRVVMGDDYKREATPAEIERMKALLRNEMTAGALGLSSGLEYDPASTRAGKKCARSRRSQRKPAAAT